MIHGADATYEAAEQATTITGVVGLYTSEREAMQMDPHQVEERRRLAVARIEDAARRLAALAHRRYLPRETIRRLAQRGERGQAMCEILLQPPAREIDS